MNDGGEFQPASFKSSRTRKRNAGGGGGGRAKQARQKPEDFMDESDGLLGAHISTHESYQAFAGLGQVSPDEGRDERSDMAAISRALMKAGSSDFSVSSIAKVLSSMG